MTTSPSGIERKVRQLDHDVQSIYEMLTTIQITQTRHGNRLQELTESVDGIGHKLDSFDGKFDAVDRKFDAIDDRFSTLDAKIDTVIELLNASRPTD